MGLALEELHTLEFNEDPQSAESWQSLAASLLHLSKQAQVRFCGMQKYCAMLRNMFSSNLRKTSMLNLQYHFQVWCPPKDGIIGQYALSISLK